MKIIKVPRINALGKNGPEKAPNLILEELKKIYNDFLRVELEEIHVDNSNVEESHSLIYKNAKEEFEKFGNNQKLVFVGGDHSISAPILKGFGETYGFEKSFLIVFDAHADCMEPMKEPTHEELLRSAVEYGFKPENIVLVGVRKVEPEEQRFLDENNVNIFLDVEEAWGYIDKHKIGKSIYVSIDIDVLDSKFAPGVNVPEEGGLSEEDLFYLLNRIFILKNLKAIDVVEVVPEKDVDNRTIKVAAEIIKNFLKHGR